MERTMQRPGPSVNSKLWRVPGLGEVELLRAHHVTQSFPRHTHEGYAVGVIERGALGFFYWGENVVAASGHLNLCVPGEVHTGQPAAPAGWGYRMFYLDARVLERVAQDVADRPCGLPFFGSGVITDAPLAQRLRLVHLRLEQPDTPRLEQETLLLGVLAQLVRHHADAPPPTVHVGREPAAVGQVKRYLERHYAEEVSLEQLSRLTCLSRYHLVRDCKVVLG